MSKRYSEPKSKRRKFSALGLAVVWIAAFLFLVSAVSYVGGSASAPAPSALSAVRLVKVKDDKLQGYCSGTHIGNGLIVTAAHCTDIEGGSVQTSIGNEYSMKLLWANKDYDVALYSAPDLNHQVKAAEIACRVPMANEPVWSVSNPLDQVFLRQQGYMLEGNVLDALEMQESPFSPPIKIWNEHMLMFLPAGPGSSGGPVYDHDGKLIGVIVGQFNRQQTMIIMVPATTVCHMLGRA